MLLSDPFAKTSIILLTTSLEMAAGGEVIEIPDGWPGSPVFPV